MATFFHIEIMISATEMLRGSQGNFEMIDAIWCVLVYYFDQISVKKVPLFIIK